MTAKPDLPINDAVPAPTKIEPGNQFLWNWRQMQVYAQACVAHATAAKDAEIDALRTRLEDTVRDSTNKIEALRAERDAAFRMSRCECAADECCANLVKHQQRAEQLAEALRDAADDIDAGVPPEDAAAHLRARADLLRDQEEGK